MAPLVRSLRRFLRDETGSSVVETVLVLPLLLWAMLGTYTFVDSYRMQSLNLRATYTIGDLLSRQWSPVDAPFIEGLGKYHEFLTNNAQVTSIRVTVVHYSEADDSHRLNWSYSTDPLRPKMDQAGVNLMAPSMPVLADADTAVIVETWMLYRPPFSIGLPVTLFQNRVFTSPRFTPQLLWSDTAPSS